MVKAGETEGVSGVRGPEGSPGSSHAHCDGNKQSSLVGTHVFPRPWLEAVRSPLWKRQGFSGRVVPTSLCIDAFFHPQVLDEPKSRPSKSQRRSWSPSFHPSHALELSQAMGRCRCWKARPARLLGSGIRAGGLPLSGEPEAPSKRGCSG